MLVSVEHAYAHFVRVALPLARSEFRLSSRRNIGAFDALRWPIASVVTPTPSHYTGNLVFYTRSLASLADTDVLCRVPRVEALRLQRTVAEASNSVPEPPTLSADVPRVWYAVGSRVWVR